MDKIKKCQNHFRHLGSLKGRSLNKAIDKLPPHAIRCLWEIAVNFIFSPYNGLRIYKNLIKKKTLKHKKTLLKLIKTNQLKKQRKILKSGGVSLALLSLLATVIASVASIL